MSLQDGLHNMNGFYGAYFRNSFKDTENTIQLYPGSWATLILILGSPLNPQGKYLLIKYEDLSK